ncbi:hypothetical protein CN692_21720 [Bacillus sp. AFS002410]|uniref:hypothetical protein n=1 Tax=Bacillus sp. AFS002410 TaxID=2033481 RepID=UPI000BEF1CE6|nr:hypothetical protein [Bacillus sp. AFS002410]PEJ53133.1 hypothetical protein CN692_21720 [Bacillus sp. AFS002410]
MEKICGPCAKNIGMSKEERMKLADSRINKQIYICPNCENEHNYVSAVKIAVQVNNTPKQIIEKKKSTKKKKVESEQFTLF